MSKESDNMDSKLDSNGDEIVYEVKHKLGINDTIQYIIMFILGIIMVYGGIKAFIFNEEEKPLAIMLLIFGISCLLRSYRCLFYRRKNRFYITNNGIGFEQRKRSILILVICYLKDYLFKKHKECKKFLYKEQKSKLFKSHFYLIIN